ncbi:GGDEF domain-containing protein [Saccharomonospora saliphila]|uniref:GGDEF domain-containing protein n=1 Tax=Saccharomonospora saliphila TaxID=369829 RepID=UPI00036F2C0A|nr:GGDEF domain-containing protein [Saccharomonospora saliphila]
MGIASRQVHLTFQPLYNLHTGSAFAVEALSTPTTGSVRDLLDGARLRGRLVHVDVTLAVRAVRSVAGRGDGRALHVNLTASTAASPPAALEPFLHALARSPLSPPDVVLEIGPPFRDTDPETLLAGIADLSSRGFRLAFDGLNTSDLPLNVLAKSDVDTIKLDRRTLGDLGSDAAATALVESLVHFADRTDRRLVATGVENESQIRTVRALGIHLAQGELLSREPPVPGQRTSGARLPYRTAAPPPRVDLRMRDFLRQARTLPADATCEQVRSVLVESDAPGGIVGIDDDGRPQWSIDRSRFLLGLTGPFGHALHVHRPASLLADPPYVLDHTAGVERFFEILARADTDRMADEVVVIDGSGRCRGVLPTAEIVRALAEVRVEYAAALNPLTRLPGSDVVADEVERRIAGGRPFLVGWLDIDSFKAVNDTAGFAAADDLIRDIGGALGDLAAALPGTVVGHVGGDDFLIACDVEEAVDIADRMLRHHWWAGSVPVSVSLATVVCASSSVESYREISRLLAPLKGHAKALTGSCWVNSRPRRSDVEVLHGGDHGAARHAADTRTGPRR